MFDFNKPNIEITEISEDKKYGKFVVEPLERGYGTTLGNSLRRIMLSSLPGAAVSHVKIDGVLHEFSSIPGVKEDVTLKAGENAYIIATVNGVQDFYLVNGDYPLPMGKAYLDGSELSGSKLQFMDTDGIDEISSAPMHKTQIFNINGQRLSSPQEGLNIINGKKVIVNN